MLSESLTCQPEGLVYSKEFVLNHKVIYLVNKNVKSGNSFDKCFLELIFKGTCRIRSYYQFGNFTDINNLKEDK